MQMSRLISDRRTFLTAPSHKFRSVPLASQNFVAKAGANDAMYTGSITNLVATTEPQSKPN